MYANSSFRNVRAGWWKKWYKFKPSQFYFFSRHNSQRLPPHTSSQCKYHHTHHHSVSTITHIITVYITAEIYHEQKVILFIIIYNKNYKNFNYCACSTELRSSSNSEAFDFEENFLRHFFCFVKFYELFTISLLQFNCTLVFINPLKNEDFHNKNSIVIIWVINEEKFLQYFVVFLRQTLQNYYKILSHTGVLLLIGV